MAVNWHNVLERVISTLTQAAVGALAAGAEYVSANGAVDWKTGLVAVGVPALLSLAKNLQTEINKDLADAGVPVQVTQVEQPSDAARAALTVEK